MTLLLMGAFKRRGLMFDMWSNLFCSLIFLCSLDLEDLLRPPPFQRLQADAVHLIEKHGQESSLNAARRLTVATRADHRVDLIQEKDAWSAGPRLTKQLGNRGEFADETQKRGQG